MSSYSRAISLENIPGLARNSAIHPLLTDLYEYTMAYGYWKAGKTLDFAVFDLYFRKNPFQGEFTVFAGLNECLKYIQQFKLTESDVEYLKAVLPKDLDAEFFEYLKQLNTEEVKVYAPSEGTVMFPRVPLLRVEGPLIITQILETTLLNVVNFATLMTTNAARYRHAIGDDAELMEMGLRRAQGPDGGITASRYAYIGGFDSTSNCLAGKLFGIPCKGTQAHSYITAFKGFQDLKQTKLKCKGKEKDLLHLSLQYRGQLAKPLSILESNANEGELAAFVSWAIAYPKNFFALLDTYEVRKSGLFNFCSVALALDECGYQALGVRIDSGDLSYLSKICRETFCDISKRYNLPYFSKLKICVSNSINEETLQSLKVQGHEIDVFGVGTNLVTCQSQPALGGVYKLVELDEVPRLKLTQEVYKITFPGRKVAYRLVGQDCALIDLLMLVNEPPPEENKRILCRHPHVESRRAYVTPRKVEKLHELVFCDGKIMGPVPSAEEVRKRVKESLGQIRTDTKRVLNPTPYKVSFSENLYQFVHHLWISRAPIGLLE